MRKPIERTLLLAALATAALEAWRPLFYLTDDNLTGYLPVATDWFRQLWHGHWAFTFRDPANLCAASPWGFLLSWISLTPFWFALVEVVSLCNSLAIAAAFCWSALWLRDHLKLEAPDWLIVLLSLSYAFTPFNLIVGCSWIGFITAQASFPLLVVGFLHPSRKAGIALQAGALAYGLYGGHAHTFIMLMLFAGLFALVFSAGSRDARPLLRFAAASAVAFVIASPLLLPALGGFASSPRVNGLPVAAASYSRLPIGPLSLSWLLGPLAGLFLRGIEMHGADPVFNICIGFALGNLLVLAAAARLRRFDALLAALAAVFAVAVLFVARPGWLAHALAHVPLLRSLQWPFRELWIAHFAAHTFAVVAWRPARPLLFRSLAAAGAILFAGILVYTPPTFYLFDLDRWLLVTGKAQRYWDELDREVGKPVRVVTAIWPAHRYRRRDQIPFVLLGTFNYGSIFDYDPRIGYSFTVSPVDEERPHSYDFTGAYTPPQARQLLAADPGLTYIELLFVDPPEWVVESHGRARRFRYLPDGGEVQAEGPWTPLPPAQR